MTKRGNGMERPDVFAYEDYRRFLKDLYRYEKARNPLFSYGVIARRAGLSSRSHPKLVMDGKRNLSGAAVDRFAKAMRLSAEETEFFRILAEIDLARSPAAKEAARKVLQRSQATRRMVHIPSHEAGDFFKSWANFLVLGLTRAEDFRADPKWISRRLQGRITPAQAAGALRLLAAGGLIRLKGKRLLSTVSGRLRLSHRGTVAMDMRAVQTRLREEATQGGEELKSFAGSFTASAILTNKELIALSGKLREWILENIPISRQRAKGELCVFVSNLYALSGPATLTGRKTPSDTPS